MRWLVHALVPGTSRSCVMILVYADLKHGPLSSKYVCDRSLSHGHWRQFYMQPPEPKIFRASQIKCNEELHGHPCPDRCAYR